MMRYNDAFINKNEIWVTVEDSRNIPFLGKGPFRDPVRISKDNYEVLKKLGYKIKPLSKVDLFRKPLGKYYKLPAPLVVNRLEIEEDNKVEIKEEDILVEEIIEPKEEVSIEIPVIIEEESVQEEEVLEESEDNEDDSITEEDIDAMTKAQLKELLDHLEIPYKYKDTVQTLRNILKENIL